MAESVPRVSQLLQASLDPAQNKQAEIALRREEQNTQYPLILLAVVANEQAPPVVRLSGALAFKNLIKRKWANEDGEHVWPEEIVTKIKQTVIPMMVSVPPNIQSQLGEAIGVIADSDFYTRWDTLVSELVSLLNAEDPKKNLGVLQVAHSIFKRWRPLFRSDDLFTEILHVLGQFAGPFLQLLQNTNEKIDANQGNKELLKEYYNQLNLLIKLFYDLSCQDLPPAFEEHLEALTGFLQKYLTFDAATLRTDSDEESGPLEYVKSGILEALTLYVQKYGDAFEPYVNTFLQTTWSLLMSTGPETKYDILVSKALHFMTSITNMREHAQVFGNPETMSEIVEKVALPNITLRESDLELFEDEPIEFIRRDLEGSDSETRRRAATDFLRSLSNQHEQMTTTVVQKYIDLHLANFTSNPSENWRQKDTAVYLFSAVASKGAVTAREGVVTINPHVNVLDFFDKNVSKDLIDTSGIHPILTVDAIKYLYVFRSQLTKEQWSQAFKLLIPHLGSSNYVIYTYAAIAVERVLALSDSTGSPLVDPQAMIPLAQQLLEHLFNLIQKDKSLGQAQAATKVQENEFLMRCVMRVLMVLKDNLQPYTEMLLRNLVEIINLAAVNPSNPRFCYYLFEATGAVVRYATTAHPAEVEGALLPPLAANLQTESPDFMPYIFQLFAGLFEGNPSGALPASYSSLITTVTKAEYWLSKGNVPALIKLLRSLIRKAKQEFIAGNHIEPVLGIFKQLINSKSNELPAFDLLDSIIVSFPPSALQNYYAPIMQLVLDKLDKSKSDAVKLRFVKFYHLFSAKVDDGLGADLFVQILHSISPQTDIYVPLYLRIVLPETPKLTKTVDRKLAVISLTKSLTNSEAFAKKYAKGWGFTCNGLLQVLTTTPTIDGKDSNVHEHDVEDMSFGVGFTELVTLRRPPLDYFADIQVGKEWVGQELTAANNQTNGRIASFVQERLDAKSQTALMEYMQ